MIDLSKPWATPYLIRIMRDINLVPNGAIGTVMEHWADGKAAEVEFYARNIYGQEPEWYTETVESEDMEEA